MCSCRTLLGPHKHSSQQRRPLEPDHFSLMDRGSRDKSRTARLSRKAPGVLPVFPPLPRLAPRQPLPAESQDVGPSESHLPRGRLIEVTEGNGQPKGHTGGPQVIRRPLCPGRSSTVRAPPGPQSSIRPSPPRPPSGGPDLSSRSRLLIGKPCATRGCARRFSTKTSLLPSTELGQNNRGK